MYRLGIMYNGRPYAIDIELFPGWNQALFAVDESMRATLELIDGAGQPYWLEIQKWAQISIRKSDGDPARLVPVVPGGIGGNLMRSSAYILFEGPGDYVVSAPSVAEIPIDTQIVAVNQGGTVTVKVHGN